MQDPVIVSAATIDAAQLHAAFTQAFADYLIGPFQLPLQEWPAFLARHDIEESRALLVQDNVMAFAFVAQRPVIHRWRLATMGALPAARGTGAAAHLLDDFIARAGAAGMARVELECFAQNERALRLYRSRGFEVTHELFGYACGPDHPAAPVPELPATEVTRDAAMDWLDHAVRTVENLPMQVTGESLRSSSAAFEAWRAGDAQLVFSRSGDAINIHSLIDTQAQQRGAMSLIAKLRAEHAHATINVPQLQRRELGGKALEALGFKRLPLHQLLMQRPC